MINLLSGLRIVLFFLFFTGVSAFCGEIGGEKNNAGSPIAVSPAIPIPQQPAAANSYQPEAPHVSYRGDYRAFRDNDYNHPDTSAQALIRLLNRMSPEKRREFTMRHSGPIARMVSRLDLAYGSGKVGEEDYAGITSGLGAFRINTFKRREGMQDWKERKTAADKNSFDDILDARRVLDSGDRNEAAAALKALKEGYPEDSGVQSAVAQYYNEIEDYGMADKAATDAISLDPGNPDSYKTRALARAALQDRKGAIEDIRKAMEMDPQDESAKILSALVDSKKEVTGLKSLSSLEEMRKNISAVEIAGAIKTESGAMESQPAEQVSAAVSQPTDYVRSNVYLKTASSKSRLGDYESALKYAGLAIGNNPSSLEAYLERANAYNFLGRYDEAVRDTTYVIGRDPASAQALNMRAWALNRKGLSKEAEADANKAIGINPDFADAWFNRALAYEKQGNYKQMLEDFRQAASLNLAYGARFQDAVAQYSSRVSDFSHGKGATEYAGGEVAADDASKPGSRTKRFVILLIFTITGGLLVALGLLHIVTSARERSGAAGKQTHPNVLTPSIFYEGVATGKYKIERKIGSGGMGVVYEAVDQSLGRTVAIKKMNEEIKVDEREKQRFLEEARTVALLHHPNIVEIHTIFEEEGNIYLVFEYVNGVTLDRMLDKEVQLPFDRARVILEEAAKALSYAHSKDVLHRDLKLSNIMISSDGEIRLWISVSPGRHVRPGAASPPAKWWAVRHICRLSRTLAFRLKSRIFTRSASVSTKF